jgi:hypothetical protein
MLARLLCLCGVSGRVRLDRISAPTLPARDHAAASSALTHRLRTGAALVDGKVVNLWARMLRTLRSSSQVVERGTNTAKRPAAEEPTVVACRRDHGRVAPPHRRRSSRERGPRVPDAAVAGFSKARSTGRVCGGTWTFKPGERISSRTPRPRPGARCGSRWKRPCWKRRLRS